MEYEFCPTTTTTKKKRECSKVSLEEVFTCGSEEDRHFLSKEIFLFFLLKPQSQ